MKKSQEAEQAERLEKHQYEIDRITEQYEADHRAGKGPLLAKYLKRYPEMADELVEFALYYHTIAADLPELDEAPPTQLSPAAQVALARMRAQPNTSSTGLEGLIQPGLAAGYLPSQLAEALEISLDVLAKLEERAIALATIPETFIQQLADMLEVAYDEVLEHLGGETPQLAYADPFPRQQESFLEAIWASPLLPDEQKHAWENKMNQN